MEAARTSTPVAVDSRPPPSRHLLKLASDERLVSRVRAGSEQAFTVLYERHHRGILSFCRHMLGSREEAEDAVQQTFTNAYKAMVGSDSEINLKPWLYRIARNQCVSLLRARRQHLELTDDEPSLSGLSDQVAQRDQLRDLLRDLAALPVEQREALVLAELHDNSHVEVAAILGCEREKVKSLVFQARNSLISSRQARELPCEEIRRQLSVLSGGALRRNTIRRHLKECEGCRAFREEVKRQRQALAVVLPVIPSAGLKFGAANAMAAAGAKVAAGVAAGGAGISATGGAVAGSSGPVAALAGKLGLSTAAVKGAAATVAVTVAAGGTAVAVKERTDAVRDSRPAPIEQTDGGVTKGSGKGPAGAAGALAPGAVGEKAAGRAERRRRQKARRLRQRLGQGRGPERKGAGPSGEAANERAQREAERRAAARQLRLKRRQRLLEERRRKLERRERQQAERRRKRRKRPATRTPAPRRALPPAGTSPAESPRTDRPAAESGTTFPSG
jgi:RNA polymerase sigma factor (sigma-70 family)